VQTEVEEYDAELVSLGFSGVSGNKGDENTPRLVNISPDPMMTGRLIHYLQHFNEDIFVGTKKRDGLDDHRIVILASRTAEIKDEHATIMLSETDITITPKNPKTCAVFVNGLRRVVQTNLYHNDRVVFGAGEVFFHFLSPKHPNPYPARQFPIIDYEVISRELQENDNEVVKLQELLIADREKQLTKP